uniref:Uncharacterized protein n=1 Tax=Oryza punctata TaxID=4537 RepID=A0A0E0LQ04_ORYPU
MDRVGDEQCLIVGALAILACGVSSKGFSSVSFKKRRTKKNEKDGCETELGSTAKLEGDKRVWPPMMVLKLIGHQQPVACSSSFSSMLLYYLSLDLSGFHAILGHYKRGFSSPLKNKWHDPEACLGWEPIWFRLGKAFSPE